MSMPGIRGWTLSLLLVMAVAANGQTPIASLSFQMQEGRILVPVQINGQPALGILDSGFGGVMLDRAFGASLGVLPHSKGISSIGLYGVSLKQVRFGPVQLNDFLAMMHGPSSPGLHSQVILGAPVIAPAPLRIDYPARRIDFFPAKGKVHCANPLPLSLVAGEPIVTVSLRARPGGELQTFHLGVDLGEPSDAVRISSKVFTTSDDAAMMNAGQPVPVLTAGGKTVQGTSITVAEIRLGKHRFKAPVTITPDVLPYTAGVVEGMLGAPLWLGGAVTFDYPHGQFCYDEH